ncbi:MAG: hypothetical protein WBO10_01180 [Pyrinomonadaceae bacterium]
MYKYSRSFIVISVFVIALSMAFNAQTPPSSTPQPDVQDRVKQLESQVLAMQAELENLKKSLAENKDSAPKPATVASAAEPSKKPDAGQPVAVSTKPAATKPSGKDLTVNVGNIKVTPYGMLFFNAFGNNSGTNNTDVPLWATGTSAGNTSASVRQTRFGLRAEGGRIGNASVKAVVEADFYGGYPAIGVGENFGLVRLRLANIRLDWEKTSVVVGQDWMVFAPNSPTSLAAAAIPQMAAAGNPWSRLPQVRLERKLGGGFTFLGAALAPGTGDYPTGTNSPALLQPGSGAASRLPFFQGRLAFGDGNWFGTKKAGSIGVSGHYGQSRVTVASVTSDIDSAGIALDWNFPIVKRVQLSGEAFTGRNLGGFQAGIFQGYNTDFAIRNGTVLTPGGVRGIGTRGGWTQIGWNLPTLENKLTAYASIGLDDPRDLDLVTVSNLNLRSRNMVYAFDLIYKFTPQFSIGAEVRRFQTRYIITGIRRADHFNLGAAYTF